MPDLVEVVCWDFGRAGVLLRDSLVVPSGVEAERCPDVAVGLLLPHWRADLLADQMPRWKAVWMMQTAASAQLPALQQKFSHHRFGLA